MNQITDYIRRTQQTIGFITGISDEIQIAADVCVSALESGNKIIFCGNGGSAADSQHLAAELMGKFLIDRNPLPALALTVDTSALTAIANDFGYDKVFERQLRGIGRSGDVLFGLSTSGNSKNVISAFNTAQDLDIYTIGMTGSDGGDLRNHADLMLTAPSDKTNHIQECHITIGHLICKLIEEKLFC